MLGLEDRADELGEGTDEEYEIWPENVTSLNVFLAMSDRWDIVVAPMGGAIYQGLVYEGLSEVWKGLEVKRKDRPQVFRDLRVMASAAKKVLNARRS